MIKSVSVIIPAYNREKTIVRAIKSVLNQTMPVKEVIVVDDHSTDNTVSKIKTIDDSRIIVASNKENRGACYSRNRGVEISTGDIVAFQDSDDEWFPQKLEVCLSEMGRNDADLVFSQFILDNGSVFPNSDINEAKDKVSSLILNPCVSTQTIVAKRKVFLEQKFDENMPRYQDFEVMLRISNKYKIYFIKEPLVKVYTQSDSLSKKPQKGFNALKRIAVKNKGYLSTHPYEASRFFYKIGTYAERCGLNGGKYFSRSIKAEFHFNVFIKMILAKTNTYKAFIGIKDKIKGQIR